MINLKLYTLTAVVLLFGIGQLSGACNYPDCVWEGIPKESGVEYFFLKLNINKTTNAVKGNCMLLQARTRLCRPNYAGCPTNVTLPYSDRLDDPAYMFYIMNLGDKICFNLDNYLTLQDCFTDNLQTTLQKYVFNDGYDIVGLRAAFKKRNDCTDEAKQLFLDLYDGWLVNNPYQTRTQNRRKG